TALEDCSVQFQLAVYVGVDRMDAWRGKRQHPANVGWCHEMPRRPHQVCSQDGAIRKGLLDIVLTRSVQTQSERPFRAGIILSLNRKKPVHHICCLVESSEGHVLINQSLVRNVQTFHVLIELSYKPHTVTQARTMPAIRERRSHAGSVSVRGYPELRALCRSRTVHQPRRTSCPYAVWHRTGGDCIWTKLSPRNRHAGAARPGSSTFGPGFMEVRQFDTVGRWRSINLRCNSLHAHCD